jgi:hypothetical protein
VIDCNFVLLVLLLAAAAAYYSLSWPIEKSPDHFLDDEHDK